MPNGARGACDTFDNCHMVGFYQPVVEAPRAPGREVFRQLEAPSRKNIGSTARFGDERTAEEGRSLVR